MSKEQSGAIDTPSEYPISIINLATKLNQLVSHLSARQELHTLLDFDHASTESNNAVHDYHTALITAFKTDSKGEKNCRILYSNALETLARGNDAPLYAFLHNHQEIMECIEKHLPALKKTLDTREKDSPYGSHSSSSISNTRRRSRSLSFSSLDDLSSLSAPYRPKPTYGASLSFNPARPTEEVMNIVVSALQHYAIREKMIELITQPGKTPAEQAIAGLFISLSEPEQKKWAEAIDTYCIAFRPIRTLLQNNEPITRVLAEHIHTLPKTPITIQISDATDAGTLTVDEKKLSK